MAHAAASVAPSGLTACCCYQHASEPAHTATAEAVCKLHMAAASAKLRCRVCRADDLRYMADKYGPVKDVYVPKDHYTGKPFAPLNGHPTSCCSELAPV